MRGDFVTSLPLPKYKFLEQMKTRRVPLSFGLEVTSRCNNNCRHCFTRVPPEDEISRTRELSLKEIKKIIDDAVSLGALWCLITGGEPLLRKDFFALYLYAKKKGLLVSVFTNATLISKEHASFFKRYPPRDIEVTVYGITQDTYERVTRTQGSFDAFMRGLHLILGHGIKVRLKAMALRSNVQELPEIARFCRRLTKDYFRFDPFLHLSYCGDQRRNREIAGERLSPSEIVSIEKNDPERASVLKNRCAGLKSSKINFGQGNHLFGCGAGVYSFSVGPDGLFRLCTSLVHPDCVYDLRRGSLRDAWRNFVPRVRDMRSDNKEFLEKCRLCPFINMCMWCPASVYLETKRLDGYSEYFCSVAHARTQFFALKT